MLCTVCLMCWSVFRCSLFSLILCRKKTKTKKRGGFCNFLHSKPVPSCMIRSLEADSETDRCRVADERRDKERDERRSRKRDRRDRRERKRSRKSSRRSRSRSRSRSPGGGSDDDSQSDRD